MHVLTLWSLFFFQKSHHFVVFRRDSNPNKAFCFQGQNPITCRWNPSSTSTSSFSCVSVHVVWLGLFQLDQNNSNQNASAQVVFFPVQPAKERSCHESNQTKHEWVWTGKKGSDLYLPNRFVWGDTSGALFLFVWRSERAERDRVGEHRQPHWSGWQIALLWPAVVSSPL